MPRNSDSILRIKEYRGCSIRPASFKLEPQVWVPEACFWLHTESGPIRLWINSFSQCFACQDKTFPNKIEADLFAYRLARVLIDKFLPEFEKPSSIMLPPQSQYFSKILTLARHPLSVFTLNRE